MQQSRLTQSFLGLPDRDFRAIPVAQKVINDAIEANVDQQHWSTGTVMTALACIVGEHILMTGDEAEQMKRWFMAIVDAYVEGGPDGGRSGPDQGLSLVRKRV